MLRARRYGAGVSDGFTAMLTKSHIEDLLMRHLSDDKNQAAVPARRKVPELKKKVFISDLELRRALAPGGRTISVPSNAIISPLAADWLEYDGIEIIRS